LCACVDGFFEPLKGAEVPLNLVDETFLTTKVVKITEALAECLVWGFCLT